MPAKSARQLAEYRAKRDFEATAEPAPHEAGEGKGPLTFMVHKHSASRLHYDLRLELDGVLVCWAIPKGPSLDPAERRLAMHVEDHPFDYGGYEGVIPKGQYGAGPSLMWDAGTFSPDEGGPTYFDDREAAQTELRQELEKGKVSVTLRGTKLKGSFALVRMKGKNEWLILKHRDAAAKTGVDILDDDRSVASGLTVDELRASGIAGQERHNRSFSPALLTGAKQSPLSIPEPMLATPGTVPTSYDGWSFEPKLDGIRVLAAINHGKVTLRSRGGHDIQSKYPALTKLLATQPVGAAVFDGEIVAIAPDGKPSFELLQQRMNLQDAYQIAAMDAQIPVVYFAFDIVHLDGYDIAGAPLADRREVLERVLVPSARVSPVATIDADPESAFALASAAGFEGIVAKRESSRYEPGRRSPAWLKRKALDMDTFRVCGWMPGTGARAKSFGGLLIGRPDTSGGWTYCGRVGSGFTDKQVEWFRTELHRLESKSNPFATTPPDSAGARWTNPELEILVEHAGFTSIGVLRTPIFKGLAGEPAQNDQISPTSPISPISVGQSRTPKSKTQNRKSAPISPIQPPPSAAPILSPAHGGKSDRGPSGKARRSPTSPTSPTAVAQSPNQKSKIQNPKSEEFAALLTQLQSPRQSLTLEGAGWSLPLTNLDKPLWPATDTRPPITKRDLLRYAATVAPYAVDHLRDRPLTLRRFPNGVLAKPFYQKHYEQNPPPFVTTVDAFTEGEGVDRTWLLCNNLPTLLWLCQLADIEWHASLARVAAGADAPGLTTSFTGSPAALDASVLSYPDFMLFDFDPYIYAGHERKGDEPEPNQAGFEAGCEVALELKSLIEPLGLTPFVKTSGATGIHVYVPILRHLDYATVRAAVNTICAELTSRMPKKVTMEWATEKRRGKVFLDANQNARHKVLAAPYSPRAKPGAPVSLPIAWTDLGTFYPGDTSLLDPWWTTQPDPWANILNEKHDLARILGLAP